MNSDLECPEDRNQGNTLCSDENRAQSEEELKNSSQSSKRQPELIEASAEPISVIEQKALPSQASFLTHKLSPVK